MTATQTDVTADKLAEMLHESVDVLEARPEGLLEFRQWDGELDISATVDVYPFLKDRLEYNSELDAKWDAYVGENGRYDYHTAEVFAHSLGGKGVYGEGEPFTINTYNGEDLLSQTLQYVYWTDEDGDAYILLQMHRGGDARGNYSSPVAFDLADDDGTSILDNARAAIYCNGCSKYWDTEDGCHWHQDGCWGHGHTKLQDYPATDQRPDYPERPNPTQLTLPVELPKRSEPCAGVIWVDEDRNGHCPYCGGFLHLASCPMARRVTQHSGEQYHAK